MTHKCLSLVSQHVPKQTHCPPSQIRLILISYIFLSMALPFSQLSRLETSVLPCISTLPLSAPSHRLDQVFSPPILTTAGASFLSPLPIQSYKQALLKHCSDPGSLPHIRTLMLQHAGAPASFPVFSSSRTNYTFSRERKGKLSKRTKWSAQEKSKCKSHICPQWINVLGEKNLEMYTFCIYPNNRTVWFWLCLLLMASADAPTLTSQWFPSIPNCYSKNVPMPSRRWLGSLLQDSLQIHLPPWYFCCSPRSDVPASFL